MKTNSRIAPAVGLAVAADRRARSAGVRVHGRCGAGTVTVVAAMAYPADLVRGSKIAVAMSASRIATSTATVISRNSACISG